MELLKHWIWQLLLRLAGLEKDPTYRATMIAEPMADEPKPIIPFTGKGMLLALVVAALAVARSKAQERPTAPRS